MLAQLAKQLLLALVPNGPTTAISTSAMPEMEFSE
jgi:hypothetical protein